MGDDPMSLRKRTALVSLLHSVTGGEQPVGRWPQHQSADGLQRPQPGSWSVTLLQSEIWKVNSHEGGGERRHPQSESPEKKPGNFLFKGPPMILNYNHAAGNNHNLLRVDLTNPDLTSTNKPLQPGITGLHSSLVPHLWFTWWLALDTFLISLCSVHTRKWIQKRSSNRKLIWPPTSVLPSEW